LRHDRVGFGEAEKRQQPQRRIAAIGGDDRIRERTDMLHDGVAGAARFGTRCPVDNVQHIEPIAAPVADRGHDRCVRDDAIIPHEDVGA
jgi:hypothetical protein